MTVSLDMGVALDLAQDREKRDAQAENSARPAAVTIRHKTTGQGEILAGPLPFGVTYLEPPTMVSGLILEKLPDRALWRLPLVTVGVMRWDTRPVPGPPGAAGLGSGGEAAGGKVLYVGAFVYFRIDCYPVHVPDTDGLELDAIKAQQVQLQAALTEQLPATAPYYELQERIYRNAHAIEEAQRARTLIENPPKVTIEHHLTFNAVALKTNLGLGNPAAASDPSRVLASFTRPAT